MSEKEKNNLASEEVVLFTVVDERSAQIKPLEGTYEVEYKYQNEEASTVLTGEVKRGEGIAPTGVTEFPAKDAEKTLEFSEIKVTPKQGWDAYAAGAKKDVERVPARSERERVMLESLLKRKATKEEILNSMRETSNIKLAELGKLFPPKEQPKEAEKE